MCLPPKHECNGKCTDAPCPSGKPKAKRELYPLENICPPNEQLCGVWSATPGHAWECVNTQRNLESCECRPVLSHFPPVDSSGLSQAAGA